MQGPTSSQMEYDSFNRSPTNGRAKVRERQLQDWTVCLQDAYPAYIAWDQFVKNQEILRANGYGFSKRGAPRKGRALLQGIAYCGRCGSRMTVFYYSTKENRSHAYGCFNEYNRHGGKPCQCFSGAGVDTAVAKVFLDVVSPAKIEIALHAMEELDSDHSEAMKQWDLQLQRAGYDVELARRRYEASDPENRLVSGELEALWEAALRRQEQLKRERAEFELRREHPLGEVDREQIRDLASDLGRVWEAETTSMEDRKALVRFLIKRVYLDAVMEEGKIRIDVEWHTGAHTRMTIERPKVGVWAPKTPQAAVERIHELLSCEDYATIASKLNEEGFQTAKGLRYDQKVVGYIARTRGWGHGRGNRGKREKA